MKFNKFFESKVKQAGVSINWLAGETNINRGSIYGIFKGTHKLHPEQLTKITCALGLNKTEENKFCELYFQDYFGESEYNNVKYIFDALNDFDRFIDVKPVAYDIAVTGNVLNNMHEIVATLQSEIDKRPEKLITNFSYHDREIDAVIFHGVKSGKIARLCHFINTDGNIVQTVFESLKYMLYRSFPLVVSGTSAENSIWAYYAVTENVLLFYGAEGGVRITDQAVVQRVLQQLKKTVLSCTPLGKPADDGFSVVDENLAAPTKEHLDVYMYEPSTPVLHDEELFTNLAKEDLPMVDTLVPLMVGYYTRLFGGLSGYDYIISTTGVDRFIASGNYSGILPVYRRPLPVSQRVRCLRQMLNDVAAGKCMLVDETKFRLPDRLTVMRYDSTVHFAGCDPTESIYCDFNIFSSVINSSVLSASLAHLKEYLIAIGGICSPDKARSFLENRILKIDLVNQ